MSCHARCRRRPTWRSAGVLLACLLAGGCASLADRVTRRHEPRFIAEDQQSFEQNLGIRRASLPTPAGVRIAYAVVPPANRGVRYEFRRTVSDGRYHVEWDAHWDWSEQAEPLPVRGTIVFLHGWAMDATSMLPWALALSERGYRGIAVDLRNHGLSGTAPVGFGPREAGDIVALVAELRRRDRIEPPLYLFGVSYGAATALFAEPALRQQLAGIVALEPFGNAADAIEGRIASAVDGDGGGLDAWLTRTVAGWRYGGPGETDRAIAELGARLGLDLDRIDTAAALAESQTCTLLLHGTQDEIVPVAVARRLADAGRHVEYVEIPGHRHVTLPLRIGWLVEPIADWLEDAASTTNQDCAELVLPPDPALTSTR